MARRAVQTDATFTPTTAPATDAVARSFRFGLGQLFETLTCAAIVVWGLQASATAYHVYGIDSVWVWAVVCLGALASFPLMYMVPVRTIICVWMAVIVVFALSQTLYSKRLAALRTEVANIIAYVDDFKLQHGLYPTDLSGYEFQQPDLAEYIEYRDAYPTTSYEIRWHPIHLHGIAHWYGADYGHSYLGD
jgi:hypothetical protein